MADNETAKLSDIIAPQFYPVYWDIQSGGHTYYDLYGGRGSTKSSFIGVMIFSRQPKTGEELAWSCTIIPQVRLRHGTLPAVGT